MFDLVIFILEGYGIVNALVNMRIGKYFRYGANRFHPMIGNWAKCAACMGFWVGVILSALGYGIKNAFLDGCILSSASWILQVVLVKLNMLDL